MGVVRGIERVRGARRTRPGLAGRYARAGCRPGRKVNAQARAQPLKTAGSGGHILPGMANKPLRPLPEGTALYGAVILERGLNMAQAMSRGEQP